jgi:hypothetical protein
MSRKRTSTVRQKFQPGLSGGVEGEVGGVEGVVLVDMMGI